MKYYFKRIATLIITIFLISVFSFIVFQILPGDPALAILGLEAEDGQLELVRSTLGLDLPIHLRYFKWIMAFCSGDMGQSIRFSMPVSNLIFSTLPVTMALAFLAMAIAIVLAIPMGVIAAKNHNKANDYLISFFSQIGMSIPSFWIGMILLYIFGLKLRWFKIGGYIPFSESIGGALISLILPAVTIAIPSIAIIVRYLRTSMIEEMSSDYVRTALSKGMKKEHVIYKHVLKNACIPVITIMGMITASVLGGSLIVEQVFSIPGIGRLLVLAVQSRDYYLIQGVVMYIGTAVAVINLLVDFVYTKLDPRIIIR